MADVITCPRCGYALEGLGGREGVRCPECGKRCSWRGLRLWYAEGRFVPPRRTALPLLAVPAIMVAAALLGTTAGARSGGALTAGFLLGWIWATVFVGRMLSFAMKRLGDRGVLLAAPGWGLIVALISLAVAEPLVQLLR
jgi:hypothetical protein